MKTPYNSHPAQHICKSGLTGFTCLLQANYQNYDEWKQCCRLYGLHLRLGFKTPSGAWRKNPQICGSVIPSDFSIIQKN